MRHRLLGLVIVLAVDFFGHQNGDKVTGVSLQLYDPAIKLPDGTPSTSHAFAQLVIERL